jgi:hypothetical protein
LVLSLHFIAIKISPNVLTDKHILKIIFISSRLGTDLVLTWCRIVGYSEILWKIPNPSLLKNISFPFAGVQNKSNFGKNKNLKIA